jgi:hypothetical protein
MSTTQVQVTHYSYRKCKFSESVDLKINGKTLVTPTFAPRLKSDGDMKVYNTVRSLYRPKQLSAYVVRLLDTGRTLYQSMKKTALSNLIVDQQTLDKQFTPTSGEKVLLIDPALEYLYYTANMERLANTPFVSHTVRDYITKFLEKSKKLDAAKLNGESEDGVGKTLFRETEHTNFWTCVYKDANMRMKLIRDTFNVELKAKTDVLIPPVPLITSSHLLDVAIDLNEKSRAFSPALSQDKRECADYFVLKPTILKNENLMSTIKEYVSTSESPLTLFKFKNLNLELEDMALERAAFKSFLMELSLVSQQFDNKAFGLLESGNQTFPAAFSSFAIVSTGFNLDREDRRKNQNDIPPFANRYDRVNMTMQDKPTFMKTMENNGHTIPCDCRSCIENPSIPENDFIEYNRRAKEHYLLCREQEMTEIISAIEKQESQMAFEKLQRSSLKNLIDIIPR